MFTFSETLLICFDYARTLIADNNNCLATMTRIREEIRSGNPTREERLKRLHETNNRLRRLLKRPDVTWEDKKEARNIIQWGEKLIRGILAHG